MFHKSAKLQILRLERRLTSDILLKDIELLVDYIEELLRVIVCDEDLPYSSWNRL